MLLNALFDFLGLYIWRIKTVHHANSKRKGIEILLKKDSLYLVKILKLTEGPLAQHKKAETADDITAQKKKLLFADLFAGALAPLSASTPQDQ